MRQHKNVDAHVGEFLLLLVGEAVGRGVVADDQDLMFEERVLIVRPFRLRFVSEQASVYALWDVLFQNGEPQILCVSRV